MIGRIFTCEGCGGTFTMVRSEDEAWAEARERFPETLPMGPDDVGLLCDQCDARFMEWFKGLTEAEKARMRPEHEAER